MYRKLIIIPVMMMLVMGCSEQEVLPTTPTKSFEGSGRYIPQSYTPTPEKGTSTGTVNYSKIQRTELERIIELEKANILLQKCLGDMYSVIYANANVGNNLVSPSPRISMTNLQASFSRGDCSNWNKNTGGN
tara:strand:+ start:285 stop:680 length:396 start_codon:yes stop_codon:yes gene_type:complete